MIRLRRTAVEYLFPLPEVGNTQGFWDLSCDSLRQGFGIIYLVICAKTDKLIRRTLQSKSFSTMNPARTVIHACSLLMVSSAKPQTLTHVPLARPASCLRIRTVLQTPIWLLLCWRPTSATSPSKFDSHLRVPHPWGR